MILTAQPPRHSHRPAPTPPPLLLTLCRYRWTIPVIAHLHACGGGSRFVVFLHDLGISRDSLSRTLIAAIDAELVRRNPGYGHPLRPEYILTERGGEIGDWCRRLVRMLARQEWVDVGFQKWTLPILYALTAGPTRFSDLRRALGVTPRALSHTLEGLVSAGLVRRADRRTAAGGAYRPTTATRRLLRHLRRLPDV